MATPSSQLIASWVKKALVTEGWLPLSEVCEEVLRTNLKGWSDDALEELFEKNIHFVAEHLRNEAAIYIADGVQATFEIDDEISPYIRACSIEHLVLLTRIREIDPFLFESLCASILAKLGAKSETTQRTYDGGVDFLAIEFDFVPDGLRTPLSCRAGVIGQAKRYKDGNTINETTLRTFIGGAIRRRHLLEREGKLQPLSPVLFAFWTTSNFEPNALAYARAMGIWFMEGVTLAAYCAELQLVDEIDELIKQTLALKKKAGAPI